MAIRRDKKCRICDAESPLTVHHLWPRGLGGGHDIENLLTLCEPCHQHLCSSCSRDESARVPGWVKPDLTRHQTVSRGSASYSGEAEKVQGSLADLFSDAATSLAIGVPKKLLFFWELAEAGTGIGEERN